MINCAEVDRTGEVHRRAEISGRDATRWKHVSQRLNNLAVIRRLKVTHVIPVNQVHRPVLAGADQQMWMPAVLVRKQQWVRRGQVDVGSVESRLIVGREIA